MFSKILVANRGEIACRIIRTAQRLGVRTVAVYSEVDVHALHVRLADEALCIGQAAPQASYLQIDRIVQAALDSGAEAVHPGYGFLSERADFCAACEQAGLVFVGPSAFAINAMGSKSQAKALMVKAGVPVVPGYHGDDQIRSCLKLEADAIGYPVLIKAVMGGGGKGMRVVASSDLFEDALLSCQREALSSFGDDRVLLEKYVARPRHIEVQVFADRHGSVVHLFDRDCSVQRRHQKVLEEAPAPNWPEAQRQAMCQAAVQAAKAVGYVGAGTVEFLVEPNGVFYFMEMNTRLQVEHPVTEMITGLDLVEWQLRVAAGEPLPLRQEDIHMSGHALEVRVYAEDPARDFLPSIGPLLYVNMPTENSYTRVDAGVQAGDAISPYYDPMIAKLIVWGEHRELSRRRMQQVLRTCHVVGVATNVAFLDRLMGCSSFVSSVLDTGLIERERAVLLPQRQMPSLAVLSLLLISRVQQHRANSNGSIWQTGAGWRLNADPVMMFSVIHDGGEQLVTLSIQGQTHLIRIQDTTYPVTLVGQEGDCWRVRQGSQVFRGWVINHGQYAHVFHEGEVWRLVLKAPFLSEGEGGVDRASLKAPMPGKVLSLRAKAGMVQAGQPLLVLEAMKMEHTIVAPCAGLLKGFHVAEGDWVSDGAELMDFEPDSS